MAKEERRLFWNLILLVVVYIILSGVVGLSQKSGIDNKKDIQYMRTCHTFMCLLMIADLVWFVVFVMGMTGALSGISVIAAFIIMSDIFHAVIGNVYNGVLMKQQPKSIGPAQIEQQHRALYGYYIPNQNVYYVNNPSNVNVYGQRGY